jgi:hypothetical protein
MELFLPRSLKILELLEFAFHPRLLLSYKQNSTTNFHKAQQILESYEFMGSYAEGKTNRLLMERTSLASNFFNVLQAFTFRQ